MDEAWSDPEAPDGAPAPIPPAIERYTLALRQGIPGRLLAVAGRLGLEPGAAVATADLVAAISERLSESGAAAEAAKGLDLPARLALTLLALADGASWPYQGLDHALRCLGVEPDPAIEALADRGLVAVGPGRSAAGTLDLELVHPHPAAVASARTAVPEGGPPVAGASVRQVRESDGLEPILRLAVVWQRVAESPLRQTQSGAFYKRDRERLDDDPAVAGPISDALEPLPDMSALWLALARAVGMLVAEPGSDRLAAAPADYWSENAYHLPQMIATRWLALWDWHEQGGQQRDGAEVRLALPFARASVLLWLAAAGPDDWVALDDLADFLRGFDPRWDRPAFQGPSNLSEIRPGRPSPKRPKARAAEEPTGSGALASMLLGLAYQLGMVRAGEEVGSGRQAVQLTPLGRYLLALGPPPMPGPAIEHFLFVQPSFEVIAYRQGLNPAIVGRFSRFARITQVGAALTLALTPESVYRGLEGGMAPDAMLATLQGHSPRPLPPGVAEAIRGWAVRRERVTYHGAATLVEFLTPEELEAALAGWPEIPDRPAPVRVTDRLLLVEDDRSIPFSRFRLSGSRNYRTPSESCVEVGPDGVTLTLDPARSDLLVDAELGRFAEEKAPVSVPVAGAAGVPSAPQSRRRFVVTPASLARGLAAGLTPASLGQWFPRRTGAPVPSALKLLLAAAGPRPPEFSAGRRLVLRTGSSELLDGLLQHPETRDYLGERIGPDAALVAEPLLPGLRQALGGLGLAVEVEPG